MLEAVDEYPSWWPWLRGFDAQGLVASDVWQCTVQPPLPYLLSFAIAIDEVVPTTLVRTTVSGEIRGRARIDISARDDGSAVRLRSELAPANRFLQAVAMVAAPIARRGHDWVLDTASRQFGDRTARS